MDNRKEKIILTDCDSVLLDWEYAFDTWAKRHGYELKDNNIYGIQHRYELDYNEAHRLVRMFNESAWIRRLPPFRDAIKYVRKLHDDHGYIFHVITSLSDDEYSQHLRTKNLRELFGETIFEKYIYLDTAVKKDHILEKYKDSGCYWIEDNIYNAESGKNLGLNSLLMSHNYNSDYTGEVTRVQNWKEIYARITG